MQYRFSLTLLTLWIALISTPIILAQTIPKGHQPVKAKFQPRGRFGTNIKYSPNGKILATVNRFGYIVLYAVESEETLENFANPKWVRAFAFRPDSKVLATGHIDGTVRLWDTGDINQGIGLRDRLGEAGILSGHKEMVNSISYSPDGKWMVSGSLDKTVRLWDANSGKHERTLSGHRRAVYSVAFSADSKIIAVACWGGVFLWDTHTGQRIQTLDLRPIVKAETPTVYTLDFSPDGETIVTGSSDGAVYLWDVDTGQRLRMINQNEKARVVPLYTVAFSPDGNTIAGSSGHIYLWDVNDTEQEPRILTAPNRFHTGFAFSPNGNKIAGIGYSEINMWETNTGKRIFTNMFVGF